MPISVARRQTRGHQHHQNPGMLRVWASRCARRLAISVRRLRALCASGRPDNQVARTLVFATPS
eukprot:9213067-Lingulodinium_polyedra.AAC.1